MRLLVLTPQAVVLDRDVIHVRAEDATGAFGILDRHADFLTALAVSVLVYRDVERREHFVAVRGGMLAVRGDHRVEVFTREAVPGDDLDALERDVLSRFRRAIEHESRGRRGIARLQGELVRRMVERLGVERGILEARP